MKKQLIVLAFFCSMISNTAFSQDLDEFLNRNVIDFMRTEMSDSFLTVFQEELYQLSAIGLDSFDCQMQFFAMEASMITMDFLPAMMINPDTPQPTFQVVADSLLSKRNEEPLKTLKKEYFEYKDILRKYVNQWSYEDSFKERLLALNKEKRGGKRFLLEFPPFMKALFEKEGKQLGRTYKEILEEYYEMVEEKYAIGYLISPTPKDKHKLPSMDYYEFRRNVKDVSKPIVVLINHMDEKGKLKFIEQQLLVYETYNLIRDKTQLVNLYLDDETLLGEDEQKKYSEKFDDEVKTRGDLNYYIMRDLTGINSVIIFIDPASDYVFHYITYDERYKIYDLIFEAMKKFEMKD